MVWIIYGHQKPNDSAGLSRSFLDNYAAEDASALFLSMRIKRLLKFIDITNSIKLCHHHLGVWMAGSLCCRRCCFCCLDACFTAWLSDAWRWQQIFHVASGSSSKQQQTAAAAATATSRLLRPLTGSKIGNSKAAATAQATFPQCHRPGEADGWAFSEGAWPREWAQTQFVWKILLVTVHILNVTHSGSHKSSNSSNNASAWCEFYFIYCIYTYKENGKKIKNDISHNE